jgi:hypothetical protein
MRERRVVLERANGNGSAAERWRSQYQHPENGWTRTVSGDSQETYNLLCDLGPTPSAEDVAEAIGNKSWSFLTCGGCSEYVTEVVTFIDQWGDSDIKLCRDCLTEAVAAASVKSEGEPNGN